MKTLFSLALFLLVLAVAWPAAAIEPPAEADASAISQGNNEFAFDLYGQLRQREGNLFFSPHSISTAFAMAYAGARGETAEEMARTLKFTAGQELLHPAFAETLKRLTGDDKAPYQLSIANRLWGEKEYKFRDEFLAITRDYYGAELGKVDFLGAAEAARAEINAWVEDATREKIKDLIPPGAVDSDTRLVLTNAIYFKGNWTKQFDKKATEDSPFLLADGGKAEAPLMFQKSKFRYGETDDLQILQLPYEGDDLSMVVLLPRQVDGLAKLEESLSAEAVAGWLKNTRPRETRVYLPRFKLTSEFSLNQALQELGMKLAFSDSADFSGMNGQRDLYLSAALHKAFVDVNEEGTEAAAATGLVVTAMSATIDEPPVFRADHPFVFLIRDDRSGSVLFLGRVTNPAEGE